MCGAAAIVIAITLAIPDASAADRSRPWTVTFGLVDTDFDLGANVTAGYVLQRGPLRAMFHFADVNLFSTDADGFLREQLPNDVVTCRDLATGLFVNDDECVDDEIDYAVSVGVGYVVRRTRFPVAIGVLGRFGGDDELGGDDTGLAFVEVFGPGKRLFGRFSAGPDYLQVSVGGAF